MFKRIRLRLGDMKTINKLILGAREEASKDGEEAPGAEHYLLSALNLSDGTAKNVFARINANPEEFRNAIKQQYNEALNAIGIDTQVFQDDPEPLSQKPMFPDAKPSEKYVMKALYSLKQSDKERPLLGAHVIAVICEMKQGVAARSIRSMGIDQAALATAAKEEIDSYHC